MYCHLRPPDAIAFPNQYLLGLQISAAVEPNAVSSRVAVGRHVNAALRVCDGLWQNKVLRVGKICGPVLSCLCTIVHEIFGQPRRPFVLSSALARLSISRFFQQIFASKSRSRRKPNKSECFGPIFREGLPQLFYGTSLARRTDHRLTKRG